MQLSRDVPNSPSDHILKAAGDTDGYTLWPLSVSTMSSGGIFIASATSLKTRRRLSD